MMSLRRYLTPTATLGKGFKPTEVRDQYRIKIYVGAGPDPAKVDKRAAVEIQKFLLSEGYATYTVAKRRYSFFPSYYEYTVDFRRE